ncbi:MAG: amino acid adenylation domain-containing protein, partial [Actinocatenispora sp.]
RQLRYHELMSRARGAARGLAERGLRPGDVCAVVSDKDVDLYPVLLGALMAGLTVAPQDISAPPARLRTTVGLAGARAVVRVGPRSLPDLGTVPVLDAVDLPDDGPDVDRCDRLTAAYLMFTSGSTGRPKPVLVRHDSLADLVAGLVATLPVPAGARLTQSAPMHFDACWQQIFCAWTAGATLLPVPDEVRVAPAAMADWLVEQQVTHWDSVPSLWYPVVDHLAANPDRVRPAPDVLLLAGEALRAERVRQFDDLCPGAAVFNIYGPTEATIDATGHRWTGTEAGAIVPIGRPLHNVRCYVLNDALRQCPVGSIGELYIGGTGVALGYLGRPSDTARVFLPDPFSDLPGQRMYATGDRVRLLSSGELAYEGRRDHVVKVRGVRVDLGEIEGVIRAVGGVREAVAMVPPGEADVVAFVGAPAGVRREDVYRALVDMLPPAVIPRGLAVLDELPKTSAGKTDRNALHQMVHLTTAGTETPSERAVTPVERVLREVWQETLRTDDVGLDDNFFQLGGDSITSIALRDRALAAGLRFKILDVFIAPTIRQLAALVVPERDLSEPAVPAPSPEPALPAADEEPVLLPLLAEQQSIHWGAARDGDQTRYCVREWYELSGPVDPAALEAAVNTLVERHAALRATIEEVDGEPVQRIQARPRFPLRVVDVEDDAVGAARAWTVDAVRDQVATRWPVFDLRLFRAGSGASALGWTMHHVFTDGWSHALLRDRLFAAYQAHLDGRPVADEGDEPDRYVELVRAVSSRDRSDAAGFWQEWLADLRPARVPGTGLAGAAPDDRASIWLNLTDATDAAVADLARTTAQTPNAVVLAALTSALARISGSGDVTVLAMTSGRGELDHSHGTVGCFVNTVPVRVRTALDADPVEATRLVGAALTRARQYEDTGIREICRAIGADSLRGVSDVLYLYQNYPGEDPADRLTSHGGLRIADIDGDEAPKLPLTVVCHVSTDGPLAVQFEYLTRVVDANTVGALVEMFGGVIDSVTHRGVAP